MSFKLLACISSHGYGHFAMTAPILSELNRSGRISLTVRCSLPEALIRSRITGDFEIIAESTDFGMIMNSSLDVDLEKTAQAYQSLHGNFSQAVEAEKRVLESYKPDLILANIPYLTIAAAKQLDIPVVAYCSLNWAEIFHSYYSDTFVDAKKIYREMNDAYNSADCFICPAPSMAMPGLNNIKFVGPVANQAKNSRRNLNQKYALSENSKLVLITPGGVATPVPVNDWPEIPNVTWITAWPYPTERKDILSIETIDIPFSDLLASCDAVVTKPGYGTVTETACNGIPVLYVLRGDWAEEPFLEAWWSDHATVLKISRNDFFSGNIEFSLNKLWSLPASSPVPASGISEVVSIVSTYIVDKSQA